MSVEIQPPVAASHLTGDSPADPAAPETGAVKVVRVAAKPKEPDPMPVTSHLAVVFAGPVMPIKRRWWRR